MATFAGYHPGLRVRPTTAAATITVDPRGATTDPSRAPASFRCRAPVFGRRNMAWVLATGDLPDLPSHSAVRCRACCRPCEDPPRSAVVERSAMTKSHSPSSRPTARACHTNELRRRSATKPASTCHKSERRIAAAAGHRPSPAPPMAAARSSRNWLAADHAAPDRL